MTKQIHIIGGGTVFHIRPHLALAAPAYGRAAWEIFNNFINPGIADDDSYEVHLYTTKMAGNTYEALQISPKHCNVDLLPYMEDDTNSKHLETNADIEKLVDELVADPAPKVIFMPVALCDFEPILFDIGPTARATGDRIPVGKDHPRLKSDQQRNYGVDFKPAEKIIRKIRKERKDIFLVGFKTTAGELPEDQFIAGLRLLKTSSCNLVLANDTKTRLNMIITPEQASYEVTTDRELAIQTLCEMAWSRSKGHFTRSTVEEGQPIRWNSPAIPETLRTVVNHCVSKGAYKPFLGSTVGHFAFKVEDGKFVTSRRKTNFNDLATVGMVLVEAKGDDEVVSYGSKPSVGGQSQRIIFKQFPDADCIVHFHCPLKKDSRVPVRDQWQHECGSHECGQNTADGLQAFEMGRFNHNVSKLVGRGDTVYAVMLDQHGPNIVFNRDVNPSDVIAFIEENFDLSKSTSGFDNA